MSQLLSYVIYGLPYGCVFGLLGMGLVLTYQTSAVFNLAFGAQAYASALVFYVCVGAGWPTWAAFLVAVVIGAPVLGALMDRGLYRFVRTKPVLVKLVAALGMLIAIPAVMQVAFGTSERVSPPSMWLAPSHVYLHLGGADINGSELSTVIVTAAVAFLLSVLFHFTQIGLRMRAIAESPRMVQLAGINAEMVGMASWMLSSFLAGLAGVMLAPIFGVLQPFNFTDLLLAGAVAAAVAGSLTSLPFTFWGGIGLGILEEVLGGYLPSGSVLSSGLRPSLPFVVLLALLLLLPGHRRQWGRVADPLAACDPPPAPLASSLHGRGLRRSSHLGSGLVVIAFVVSCLTWISGNWVFTLSQALALGVVFLSLVLLTGMSGQISLCQMSFAGVGAFTTAQLASHNVSVLLGVLAGGLLAAAVGAVVALPALRLGGLALALATLAFGLLADNIGFQFSWSGNGVTGVSVPRPQLGPINFSTDRSFFVLVVAVLALSMAVVAAIRRGTTGRELAALRGSELAASAVGVNPVRAKVIVFALSAGLAGIGGGLYASLDQSVSASDFNTLISLVLVVVVATIGVYTIEGAVEAGLAYVLLNAVLTSNLAPVWSNLLEIVFGAGAILYVLHPEGAVEYLKRSVLERVPRRRPVMGAEAEVGA